MRGLSEITGRQLRKIDRATKSALVLTSTPASPHGLAAGRDGHLYYAIGPRLHRYLRGWVQPCLPRCG